MLIDFEPGDYVKNPANSEWGIGQVQSIIGNKVTVNFENYGKRWPLSFILTICDQSLIIPSPYGSHGARKLLETIFTTY